MPNEIIHTFLFSVFSKRSIGPTIIKILLASLFFGSHDASDLINSGIAHDQQMQDSSNSSPGTMREISSAGTFEIVLDIDPFPIEPDRQTMLNITFIRLAEPAVIQINVGYDVFILDENDNTIFRASNTIGQEKQEDFFLHSTDGIILFPFRFESTGDYTVHVKVLRVNFIPIHPEFVDFPITVVPEFGSIYVTAISASALTACIMGFQVRKLIRRKREL
jgi:hypothetical protein